MPYDGTLEGYEPPHYHVAQVCLNGHLVTGQMDEQIELAERHCSKCGAETIAMCPSCSQPIRGDYSQPFVPDIPAELRAYCHNCGAPYPWTEARLEAARELVELADVSDDEKQSVKDDLPNLLVDTPRTNVAVAKIKKFLAAAGQEVASGLRKLLVEIASEAVKKQLGL